MDCEYEAHAVNPFFAAIKNNALLLTVYAVMLISVFLGPAAVKFEPVRNIFVSLTDFSLSVRSGGNIVLMFLFSLVCFSGCGILPFLSGISVGGVFFSLISAAGYGVSVGSFASVLYSSRGTSGILIFVALYSLPMLISGVAVMLQCREAFAFSLMLAHGFSPDRPPANYSADFRVYCKRSLFVICMFVCAAAVSTGLSAVFLKMLL